MTHWLDKVVTLLQADTSDLRELARIAGADPRVFYRGVDIKKLDLNGQNLEGLGFSNPLTLDLSDAEFKKMIKRAKKNGFITFDQLNNVLPSTTTLPAQIEDIMSMLMDMGIDIVEEEPRSDEISVKQLAYGRADLRRKTLQKIRKISRQEERVAVFLDEILQNRSNGMSALLHHEYDRGKFATAALSDIYERILANQDYSDEFIVACLISRLYNNASSFNRGPLLYFLAKHLSKYPRVNRSIRQRLTKPEASVQKLYSEIMQFLQVGPPTSS